ncbi:MAG: hypothetical protein ACON35_04280 [Candidatus Marinamargulisbacteria bacterium]
MAIINPFLLAGPDQIEAYQKSRIKEWESKKKESHVDFDHYFDELIDQWSIDDFNETMLDIDAFDEVGDFEPLQAKAIQSKLKNANILNQNGYINLKHLDQTQIIDFLNDLPFLTDAQKKSIINILTDIQKNVPTNFETFSKTMFTFYPQNNQGTITESQSKAIWDQLNQHNIIDDYGVLLYKPNSDDLTTAVSKLTGLTREQKDRVLALLNQHPELSYHNYIKDIKNQGGSNALPTAGIYLPGEANVKKFTGLSQEELNYIRIIAVMEWNVMLISQKSIHKSRKKSISKVKSDKKQTEKENMEHNEKIAAKYREEFQRSIKKSKKK